MPLYMDLHIVPGITAKGAAEAHRKDSLIQKEFGCRCMTYWVDEENGCAFCLIKAPRAEAVKELHNNTHGLIPHKIIEVNSTVVEAFLGRIYDPDTPEILEGQLKVFNDPAFRVLVLIKTIDMVLLAHAIGRKNAEDLSANYKACIKQKIREYNGEIAEHNENITILSFTSAFKAINCAWSVQNAFSENDNALLDLKMNINAGMPVSQSPGNRIFNDTIALGKHLFYADRPNRVMAATTIQELTGSNYDKQKQKALSILSPSDEKVLNQLMNVLETNSSSESFNVNAFCKQMMLSASSLNRITHSLTGKSPNILLKEFRLDKALLMLHKGAGNVSQVAFSVGFGSPAYFSKCFKKQFSLSPSTYISLLKENI